MKAAAIVALIGLGLPTGAAWAATVRPKPVTTCTGFRESFVKAALPHAVSFERPLTITRGFFGDEAGIEVRTLATRDEVEGTLKCRGEEFRRFEVRVVTPVSDETGASYKDYQQAALTAAFGWDRAKVATIVGAMSSDAAEYLRASVQRGDLYVAGKVEYHQGDALDLGVIWTDADRTFVITSQTDE